MKKIIIPVVLCIIILGLIMIYFILPEGNKNVSMSQVSTQQVITTNSSSDYTSNYTSNINTTYQDKIRLWYYLTRSNSVDYLFSNNWLTYAPTDIIFFNFLTITPELTTIDSAYYPLMKKIISDSKSNKRSTRFHYCYSCGSSDFVKYTDQQVTLLSKELINLSKDLDLTGISIDIEYPNTREEQDKIYLLVSELKKYRQTGLEISVNAGIAAWMFSSGGHFTKAFCDLNKDIFYLLMSYGKANYNGIAFMQNLYQEYLNKGIPKSNLFPGIPFFGKNDNENRCYCDYVDRNLIPDLITDQVPGIIKSSDLVTINNIKTIKDKTTWILNNKIGGLMVWHWKCDKDPGNSTSLTKTIIDTVNDFYKK